MKNESFNKEKQPKYIANLYHNILWSNYKAEVFSSLFHISNTCNNIHFNFYQIAETERQRIGLSSVDIEYHCYPYELMFTGSYNEIPTYILTKKLFLNVFKAKADLILLPGYYRPEHWAMLLACILRRKRCIVFSDSTLFDKPHRLFTYFAKQAFLFLCDAAFTYGERGKEHLIAHGMDYGDILIRRQAAALPRNYVLDNVITDRIRYASKTDAPRFLFVGRLSIDKSIDILLKAFAITLSVYQNSSLIIIGGGLEEISLKTLASDLGISDRVTFCGGMELDTLAKEYQQATCLILPSRKEPWGLVANEALHYGCPVIVSANCGCVPDLFDDEEIGTVFQADNIKELSGAMIAAPKKFSDIVTVAQRCLNKIAEFTPSISAQQIYDGCLNLLSK